MRNYSKTKKVLEFFLLFKKNPIFPQTFSFTRGKKSIGLSAKTRLGFPIIDIVASLLRA
jgi:hypothetical protein